MSLSTLSKASNNESDFFKRKSADFKRLERKARPAGKRHKKNPTHKLNRISKERKTRLELATTSLEGWSSTN